MRTCSTCSGGKEQNCCEENQESRCDSSCSKGTIYLVGMGPGNPEEMTVHATRAIACSEYVVAYKTYIELLSPGLLMGKEIISTGMMGEVERCKEAVRIACTGKKVSVVSSGDAGIYGMSGLVLEILQAEGRLDQVNIEMVPGVTAAQAAAAVLGAPLMNDFAVLSLSDLLTPLDKIMRRAEAAASGGFVTALYNPKSVSRTENIEKVREIFLKHRPADTLVGIVKNALRSNEKVIVSTLDRFIHEDIDMFTMVIIGNEDTKSIGDYLVTVRGYSL